MKYILNKTGINILHTVFPKLVKTWKQVNITIHPEFIRFASQDLAKMTLFDLTLTSECFEEEGKGDINNVEIQVSTEHLANMFKKAGSFDRIELDFTNSLIINMIRDSGIITTMLIPCEMIEESLKRLNRDMVLAKNHFRFHLDKSIFNDILSIAERYSYDDRISIEKINNEIIIQSQLDQWVNTTNINLDNSDWIEGIDEKVYTYFSLVKQALDLTLLPTIEMVVIPDEVLTVNSINQDHVLITLVRCQKKPFYDLDNNWMTGKEIEEDESDEEWDDEE